MGAVHELFHEHVRKTPDAIAIVQPGATGSAGTRVVTYVELDQRAEMAADQLRSAGIKAGDFVAIMMARSIEMIVSMLATLKVGAAYVPLDPTYPDERLHFMLADTAARVCLTQAGARERCGSSETPVIAIDTSHHTTALRTNSVPAVQVLADAPAYVMYTSGSTGKPKGVLVPHRGIIRLVRDASYARLDNTTAILHAAPPSFDASTFEIWGALANGGRCVLGPHAVVPDLAELKRVIAGNGVTTVWLTASLFNMIIDRAPETLATVTEVLTGGEALSVPHVRRALRVFPHIQFINGYGPTETTTFACCYRIPRTLDAQCVSVPIGTPIAKTSVHLFDEHLRSVAAGQPGDLYIGGDGVALGYLNRPDLTAERFIQHPNGGSGARLYRTGDRARRLADGSLEFLGRIDDQVKIRGYRVELGEVEAVLRTHGGLKEVAVVLREDQPGEKRLVAYYTPAAGSQISLDALRRGLSSRLPEYMVPSHFVMVDPMPLTPNGKIDRRNLPSPGRHRPLLERQLLAPRTSTERWLAGLWRRTLDLDDVGVHDRFFELGGTSLTAVRLLDVLCSEMGTRLSSVLLFRAGTIAELADILDREYKTFLPPAVRGTPQPALMCSMVGERSAERRDQLLQRRMNRRHGS